MSVDAGCAVCAGCVYVLRRRRCLACLCLLESQDYLILHSKNFVEYRNQAVPECGRFLQDYEYVRVHLMGSVVLHRLCTVPVVGV